MQTTTAIIYIMCSVYIATSAEEAILRERYTYCRHRLGIMLKSVKFRSSTAQLVVFSSTTETFAKQCMNVKYHNCRNHENDGVI